MLTLQKRIETLRVAVASFTVVLIFARAPNASAEPPAATVPNATASYYNSVLRAMNALPLPQTLQFQTKMTALGAGVDVYEDDGNAVLAVGYGRSFHHDATWSAQFLAPDHVRVTTDDGHQQKTASPVFNPTWRGAYDWLRYGIKGQPTIPAAATPTQTPASAAPDNSDSSPLPTIGSVQAIGTAFYRVEDEGATPCPSAQAGRHLHLIAYRDPSTHPVTDMVVEESSKRICSIRFRIKGSSVFGASGNYQLDFGDRNGYWLVTGGNSDLFVRIFGLGAKHITLSFAYDYIGERTSPIGSP